MLLAAVVLDDQQHRELRPALLRSGNAGGHRSGDRPPDRRRPRYNGIVLPGDGFEGDGSDLAVASDPAVQALFRGEPRGFCGDALQRVRAAPRHRRTRSTRRPSSRASAGVFHNRVTLNDSTLLGGNPPFQPRSTRRERQRRQPGRRHGGARRDLPFGMHGAGHRCSSTRPPTCGRRACSARSRSASSSTSTYVGRRGLYLQRERNINQLLPGTIQANPGVNIAALRPYKGYGAIRLVGERRPLELQQPADQRRSPLQQWPEGRRRLHARQVRGQRQRQARRAVEHLRRHELLGAARASTAGTC